MDDPARRTLLATVGGAIGGAGLASTGGARRAAGSEAGTVSASAGRGWPMYRHDAANTGSVPDGAGPTTGLAASWQFATGSGAGSPAVVGDTVYVPGWDDTVTALDAATGTEWWSADVAVGPATPPAVVDGTLYYGNRTGGTTALDATSGDRLWRYEADGSYIQHPPVVESGTVYGGNESGIVYALDAATGEQQWLAEPGKVTAPTAVAEGHLYVATWDDGVQALDDATGKRRWTFEVDASGDGALVVADGRVYVTGLRDLFAVDAASGEQLWHVEHDRSFGSPSLSPPGVTDDGTRLLYAGSLDETLHAFDARTGERRWSTALGEQTDMAPAVVGDTVYVATGRAGIQALSAATGERRWRHDGDGWRDGTPVVAGGALYGVDGDGVLHAFTPRSDGRSTAAGTGGSPAGTATGGSAATDGPGPTPGSIDWLEGWYPLLAGLAGVPVLGALVLGTLMAAADRFEDG